MTDNEKLTMLSALVGETDQSVLALYLQIAKAKIMEKLYPLVDTDRDSFTFPSLYDMNQIQIAQYLYNQRGTWGMTSHTEQGVTDTYASSDVPPELLKNVLSYCSVPSRIAERNADA